MRTAVPSFNRVEEVRKALLSGKVMRSQDLADIVGVSLRTVYRYILELRQSGEQIIGEAGVGFQMVRKEKTGVAMAGPAKPLTQLEIYETLAASYERSAISLREQAEKVALSHRPGTMHSFFSAAYTADVLRAGALDVVEKLKRN